MRLALVLLALLLAAPLANAQMSVKPAPYPGRDPVIDYGPTLLVDMRIDSPDPMRVAFDPAWVLVGHDNFVNFTLRNFQDVAVTATFKLEMTGGTVSPSSVTIAVDPRSESSTRLSIRPDDVGYFTVTATSEDAFGAGGTPLMGQFNALSMIAPAIRLVDPPAGAAGGVEDGFERLDTYGGSASAIQGFLRVNTGDRVVVRLEARNVLNVPTPAMRVSFTTSMGEEIGPVDVPALQPGESRSIEFQSFSPTGQGSSYGYPSFGPGMRVELRFLARTSVAGVESTVALADYAIRNGAVVDLVPVSAAVEVQDGVSVDLVVPKKPVLGTPTRVRFNLTNNGAEPVTGEAVITLQTPGGVYYEVQGPEVRNVHVALDPGEFVTGTIDWTPRVTGGWSLQTTFYSSEGYGYGGGGASLFVDGPVSIRVDTQGVTYARIGEPVSVDVSVSSTSTLQGAELRVSSGGMNYYGPARYSAGSGDFRAGMQQGLLKVGERSASLETLRPGGEVNATVELVGRAAGRYSATPYVLAEGFAYTSTGSQSHGGPGRPMVMYEPSYYGSSSIELAVQARPVPTAVAMFPLTVGLAVFVGMWTLRTRFVK